MPRFCMICIHAKYTCMSVEPPHCLAFTMMSLMGIPAVRCPSMSDSRRRCGRLSMNGIGSLLSLSVIFTHVEFKIVAEAQHIEFDCGERWGVGGIAEHAFGDMECVYAACHLFPAWVVGIACQWIVTHSAYGFVA